MRNMKVKIDDSLCTGCAVCSDLAPEIFELTDDMISIVKNPGAEVPGENEDAVNEAIDSCPVGCIEKSK